MDQALKIVEVEKISTDKSAVIKGALTKENLSALFNNEICVLHVSNFISDVVSSKLHSFFMQGKREKYTHEQKDDAGLHYHYYGVDRVGTPLNSVYNDSTGDKMAKYFNNAAKTLQAIREAVDPYITPIDKLRVMLDEAWPHGANLASLQGKKMFCGIGRIMPAAMSYLSAEQPHYDMVPVSYFPGIQHQFAANIYLNVPHLGGELEIWDVPPLRLDQPEFDESNWRANLPKSIIVKPNSGDLLLFNTRRPHAITSFDDIEYRTSIQTFIGMKRDKQLFLWD